MSDRYDLKRFVEAQDRVFDDVLAELRDGRKHSHWMWFVFPQIAGLGRSPSASRYAIGSMAEAEAYLAHTLLGPRLKACTDLVNTITDRSVQEIFGSPDDLKFRSSMTLFSRVGAAPASFNEALERFFAGRADEATLTRLPK